MLPRINSYSFWIPWQITLPTTTDIAKVTIPLEEPREWLFDQISISYPAIGGAAPTIFNQLRFNVQDIRRKYIRFYDPVSVRNYTTPGAYENFALNANPRNNQWLHGKKFNMLFAKRNSVEITVSNFIGAANPLVVDLVLFGDYFLGRSEIIKDG